MYIRTNDVSLPREIDIAESNAIEVVPDDDQRAREGEGAAYNQRS